MVKLIKLNITAIIRLVILANAGNREDETEGGLHKIVL
jgi:hypothetical protein